MTDFLLGWFVIVAPFALSSVFILIPSKSEHPQHHKMWRFGLLIFGLLFSGISAWQQHRSAANATKSAQEGVAETTANVKAEVEREDSRVLEHQRKSIQTLSDALTSKANESLLSSRKQFKSTVQKVNHVLVETEKAAGLSAQNLSAITGESSYPCVVPDALAMVGIQVPFAIWNKGKNPLTGVEVSITNMPQYQEQRIAGKSNAVAIGTLRPEWPKSLPAILPIVEKDEIAYYMAEIWTQNGFYTETINFRKARKGTQHWAFQYWLFKQEVLDNDPKNQFPHLTGKSGWLNLSWNVSKRPGLTNRWIHWADGVAA